MKLVSSSIETLVFVNAYSPFLLILFSKKCLFIVSFVLRRKNHRAECQAQTLSACSSSQLVNWWLSPDQHLYSKLGHGSCIKKTRWVFHSILFYILRAWLCVYWEYFHWSPPSSRCIWQDASGGQIDWSSIDTKWHRVTSNTLCLAMLALRRTRCHNVLKSTRDLCFLNLCCFASPGKVPFL